MNKKRLFIIFIFCLLVIILLGWLYIQKNAQEVGRMVLAPNNLKTIDIKTNLSTQAPENKSPLWAALDDKAKKAYETKANHFKLSGLASKKPLKTKSNQDHVINQYYEYAQLRLKKLKTNGKLNNQWLEAFFKDIPLWRQNLFAFEESQDISFAKQSIELIEKEINSEEVNLAAFANMFAYTQDLPIELQSHLPFWFHRFDVVFEKQFENSSTNALGLSELMRAVAVLGFDEKYSKKWIDLQENLEKLEIPIDFKIRFETAKNLMEAIYLAKEQGVSTSTEILERTRYLAREMMYILEPDGCLPQIGLQTKRENYREYLYYAAEIFDQNDFRFVAFGGYRNPHILQPNKTSILLNSNQIVVLRSNWNILWTQPILPKNRVYGFRLGENNSSQIVFDLKTKEASFYAQNKPQFKFVFSGIDIKSTELKLDQEIDFDGQKLICDVLIIPDGFKLTFLKKIGFWYLSDTNPNLRLDISNYRSEVTFENNSIVSNHLPRRSVFFTYDDDVKYSGDFVIKGFTEFENKIDSSNQTLFEGYYNVGKISKCNELIVEANPNVYFPIFDKNQVRMMPEVKMDFLNRENGKLKLTSQYFKPTTEKNKNNENK